MTEALYLQDSYKRQFDAIVLTVGAEGVLLDRTAFYPAGGGQPDDRGTLAGSSGASWAVTGVEKTDDGILHRVAGAPPPVEGERLRGEIDWTRRYTHMRYHSLLHILSGVAFQRFGSGITGGQIYDDRARMDFSLPEFTRSVADELVTGVRTVVARDLPIVVRTVPRSELVRDPTLVRVAAGLLPPVDPVRLIDIVGHDVQADGGTHVRSTGEVGDVMLDRLENKGARNKRLYLRLGPPRTSEG